MSKLATEFGLSDVALHKICRKHDVPTPPVGYWAKKAHGKAGMTTPLPRPEERGAITISQGATSDEGGVIADARAAIREALGDWQPDHEAPTTNAIVERTIARLERSKPGRAGLVTIEGKGLISVAVRPDSVERAARILRLLADAAAQAGISLDASGRPAVWQYQGEHVSFSFEEAADRVEHVPTEKELRAVARWEAERQAYFKRYGYEQTWGKPHIPKWEEVYQGRLAVRLEEVRIHTDARWWGPVIRRGFADSKTQDLARMIPRILATVAAIAVAKSENRIAEERRRRAEEEAARRWEAARRREELERARAAAVDELVEAHQRLLKLEAFVEALRRHAPDEGAARARRLLCWAEGRLRRLGEATFGAGLDARLTRERLFGEDEEE